MLTEGDRQILCLCNNQNIYHFIYWRDKFCMQKMCYLKFLQCPWLENAPPPPLWRSQGGHRLQLETKGVKNPDRPVARVARHRPNKTLWFAIFE